MTMGESGPDLELTHRVADLEEHTAQERVSLKEYLNQRLDAMEEARQLAYKNLDTRLIAMNEFRAEANDRMATYLTRDAYEARQQLMAKSIKDLELSRAELAGKASQTAFYISLGISVCSLLIGGAGLIMTVMRMFGK